MAMVLTEPNEILVEHFLKLLPILSIQAIKGESDIEMGKMVYQRKSPI